MIEASIAISLARHVERRAELAARVVLDEDTDKMIAMLEAARRLDLATTIKLYPSESRFAEIEETCLMWATIKRGIAIVDDHASTPHHRIEIGALTILVYIPDEIWFSRNRPRVPYVRDGVGP